MKAEMPIPVVGRVFLALFGLAFVGGPIAMAWGLWTGWGQPPLPMRIAGTLICVAVAAGGLLPLAMAIRGKLLHPAEVVRSLRPRAGGFARKGNSPECAHCGAPVGDQLVELDGTLECAHCGRRTKVAGRRD